MRSHKLDIYSVTLHSAYTKPQCRELFDAGLIKDRDIADFDGRTWARFEKDGSDISVLVHVVKHPTVGNLVNTLSHEAAHAAGMILDHVGQQYDGDSEAYAYLVGWISEWLWTGLKPKWRRDA